MAARPDPVSEKAGIKEFEVFGAINIINALAGGDILKWEAILQLPYEKVLTKLILNKTEYEYQKRYAEIIKTK